MVVQHDENNIHVNEATGHIAGIADWADAMNAPFGVSLGGLETVLGVQTSSCWHFHPYHVELREHFWDTFYREIGQISVEMIGVQSKSRDYLDCSEPMASKRETRELCILRRYVCFRSAICYRHYVGGLSVWRDMALH
jgi:hypothetical protein